MRIIQNQLNEFEFRRDLGNSPIFDSLPVTTLLLALLPTYIFARRLLLSYDATRAKEERRRGVRSCINRKMFCRELGGTVVNYRLQKSGFYLLFFIYKYCNDFLFSYSLAQAGISSGAGPLPHWGPCGAPFLLGALGFSLLSLMGDPLLSFTGKR